MKKFFMALSFTQPLHMKTILHLVTTTVLCCITLIVQAQTDSLKGFHPKFKLSLNYNTALNYYGRTDSLKSSGFFPLAEVWLTSKIYISAAPVFVNNRTETFGYAGSVATIGFQTISKKWITNLYLSKPVYKESSELLQSTLKLQGGASVSFLNRFVNINLGGEIKRSDRFDFVATGGLDHLIRIQSKDKTIWAFDPSVYVYAGTQNFQRSYYKKGNSNFLLFPRNEQLVTEKVSQLSILAYEAMMPIIYAKKKWTYVATPAFIIPQNLIGIPNRPDLSEQGSNTFYATLTAKYSF